MITALVICLLAGRVDQWVHHPHFGGVNHMVPQGNGIAASTAGGVLFFTAGSDGIHFDSTWTYQGRLNWDRVAHIHHDPQGNLWVSYLGGGIDMFSPDGTVTGYGQLEGLPLNLMVNQVHADTVIYAATSQGLSVKALGFFQTFNSGGTGGGLPSSVVNCIAPSDSGLLVGTYSGLSLLLPGEPPGQYGSWRQVEELSGRSLNALEYREDTLWVISGTRLYMCPPGGEWFHVTSYPGGRPSALLSASTGMVVGDQNSVHTYSSGEWSTVEGSFAGGLVTSLAEAEGGIIVAGLTNSISEERLEGPGFALIRGSGQVTRHVPPGGISNDIYSIGLTSDGTCWVGSHRSGVGYFTGSGWHPVPGLMPSGNQIFALGARGNTVFAGSYHNGVTWIEWDGSETGGSYTFTKDDGLLNNQITGVAVWDHHTVWFAQEPFWATPEEPSGVSLLTWQPGHPETASFVNITSAANLPGKFVRDVLAVSGNTAWAGTSGGLAELSTAGGVTRVLGTAEGLPSSDVRSLALTRSGDLYAGTSLGLVRVRNGTVQPVPGITGSVESLCADHRGSVWAAVPGTLYRIGPGGDIEAYTRYNSPLPEVDVRDMACDHERGRLWLATSRGVWMAELGQGLFHQGDSPLVYPNPFRPGAGETLGVSGIPDEPSTFRVFDLCGILLYQFSSSGRDDFAWDGAGSDGSPVPSGLYVLVLEQGGSAEILKFAVIR